MQEPKKGAKQLNGATPGAILRHARQVAGLSVDQVAARLYLLCSVVRNLEADNYQKIRGDTFVRGYLRNYSRLLGVPSEPLLVRYDKFHKDRVPPELLPEARSRRIGRDAGRIGSLALLLGIGALPLAGKRDTPEQSPYPNSAPAQVESTQYGAPKTPS